MKIGLSLSKCVADIHNKLVDENDVLVIIAHTCFDIYNQLQWEQLWRGYTANGSFWVDFKDQEYEIRGLVQRLIDNGKVHQPRLFENGDRNIIANNMFYPNYWLDVVCVNDQTDPTAVVNAWNHFKLLTAITK